MDDALETRYQSNFRRYDSLREEVEFAIRDGLDQEGVKFHTVNGRVKTRESFLEKVERKRYEHPFEEMPDLVGVRVVVLFLSDLPRVTKLVKELFDVRSEEDRVHEGADTTFGYMSIHFVAMLGAGQTGPRYDALKDLHFEIQLRTIVMDAWANVSHYLAYKGESSIPQRLRRDFNALSGLFYVADQHFELFVKEERASEVEAQEIVKDPRRQDEPVELNLDTLVAVLRRVYPDRSHVERANPTLSRFVEELGAAGLDDARELERVLRRIQPAFQAHEKEEIAASESGFEGYVDVGAARMSMALANDSYREAAEERGVEVPDLKHRKLIDLDA